MNNTKNCIVTISRGGNRPWFDINKQAMLAYADMCDADFIQGEDLNIDLDPYKDIKFGRPETGIFVFERLPIIGELLKKYDRVLWLDDTCSISQYCPNLFDIVPYGYVGAHNEGILDWVSTFKNFDKLLEKNNHPLKIKSAQYFNAGVLLVDQTHSFLFEKETLLKYGNLGYFSDFWVDQTYLNITTAFYKIPVFHLPYLFNVMLVYSLHEKQKHYLSLFLDEDILRIDDSNIPSFINDESMAPGGYNHAFIWHLTSFWEHNIKFNIVKELSKYMIR